MKKLDLVPKDDDSQFKIGDTNTRISFTTMQNQNPVALSTGTMSMFQIKNQNGFVQSCQAKIQGETAVLNSKDLANLPVGQYELELWHQNIDGTNDIYPDQGWLPFTINENATGTVNNNVTSITLDQLSQQLSSLVKSEVQKAVAAIPKPHDGKDGTNGMDGQSPTIMVGQVNQSPAGTFPKITDSGGKLDHIFNFTFPEAQVGVDTNQGSLNECTSTGFYAGNGAGQNGPTTNNYSLFVIASDNSGSQLLIDVTDGRAWTRGFHDSTFTNWRQVTQWN